MILNHTHVGRYAFVFDVNHAMPFPSHGELAGWDADDATWEINEDRIVPLNDIVASNVGRFAQMQEWLKARTHTYRVSSVEITTVLISANITLTLPAIMVEMSEDVAPIFKLYWYGRVRPSEV